jgi:hypothetical protein
MSDDIRVTSLGKFAEVLLSECFRQLYTARYLLYIPEPRKWGLKGAAEEGCLDSNILRTARLRKGGRFGLACRLVEARDGERSRGVSSRIHKLGEVSAYFERSRR